MEEWMTNFLSNREATFATGKQKDEAIRAFAAFKDLDDKEAYQDQLKEVCRRIDHYVSQAKPRPAFNQNQTLVLDPFFDKLLDFVISLASLNTDIHVFLRDETSLLATLTSYLNDKYQQTDQAKILKAIEMLSRGIIVSWSAPYLGQLIKQAFNLLQSSKSPEIRLSGLRIVSNLIFNNQNCLNMVLREANYRVVLKLIISWLSDKASSSELVTMGLNFCFLTDQAFNMSLSTQVGNIRNTFAEIQVKIESENFKDVQGIATTLFYVTLCVSTILNRCAREYGENSTDCINGNNKETRIVQQVVEEISSIVFNKFFTKVFPLLRTDKGQIVVVSLLNLMKALCPTNIPTEEYEKLWEGFAKSLNELSMVASSKSRVQITVLETHLHFVDRIIKANKKNVLSAEAFKYALNNCQIVVSAKPIDLSRNILTIRLLNRLNVLAGSCNRKNTSDSVVNKVAQLLSEESLSKLLYELLSENTGDSVALAPCIQMSTCVVEILNVISKLSKSTTALMESLEKEKTWFHISNCIINGNEELITQALVLLGAVGFSAKCRLGVSRILMEMRESYSPSKSLPVSPERPIFPSVCATMGMKNLNDNLEMFEQNHIQGNDQAIDDVLAWYKLKNDMHEMELSNMNDHIFQLNRTNSHLKTLLNKQSELIAKRAVCSSTMKKDFTDLQRQLEATKEKKVELEVKHMKAMQSLRQQLTYQEELYKTKCDRLVVLERELTELKATCAELKTSRDEAITSSRQVTTEKRKLQEKLDEVEKEYKISRNRLSTMEADLKKSEEARKTAEALLEAERRKTEIIQQVLGNRLN